LLATERENLPEAGQLRPLDIELRRHRVGVDTEPLALDRVARLELFGLVLRALKIG
jgi:hypothetical protein